MLNLVPFLVVCPVEELNLTIKTLLNNLLFNNLKVCL